MSALTSSRFFFLFGSGGWREPCRPLWSSRVLLYFIYCLSGKHQRWFLPLFSWCSFIRLIQPSGSLSGSTGKMMTSHPCAQDDGGKAVYACTCYNKADGINMKLTPQGICGRSHFLHRPMAATLPPPPFPHVCCWPLPRQVAH